jgi:hypothetical protein
MTCVKKLPRLAAWLATVFLVALTLPQQSWAGTIIQYTLDNVTLASGHSVSGTFTFDASASFNPVLSADITSTAVDLDGRTYSFGGGLLSSAYCSPNCNDDGGSVVEFFSHYTNAASEIVNNALALDVPDVLSATGPNQIVVLGAAGQNSVLFSVIGSTEVTDFITGGTVDPPTVTGVPEPGTLAILGVGLLGLLAAHRRPGNS